jgi:hypothetical protein
MKKKILTALIFVYFLFLLHHAIYEISWFLFSGVGLAIWSHTRKGWATPSLLILHMSLEWVEWLHSLVLWAWLGRLVHATMDVAFFQHEISAHKRAGAWIWGGAIFLLILISSSFLFKIPEEALEILHQFSLGGAVGCVGSHIYFHIKKE